MKRFYLSVIEKCKAITYQLQLATGAVIICVAVVATRNTLHAQEATAAPYLKATLSSFNQVPSVVARSGGRLKRN
jgi:hypothetical protein